MDGDKSKAEIGFIQAEDKEIDSSYEYNKKYSSIKYLKTFDSNIDIEVTPKSDGFKESIILQKIPEVTEFEYKIYVKNVVPKLREDGNIYFIDEEKNLLVGQIPAPVMYDSSEEETFSYNIKVELEKISEDKYLYRIIPDVGFLNDKSRVYPIVIDPSYAYTRDYISDTFVTSEYPNNNYTADDHLKIGNSSSLGISRGFFKVFNLMEIVGGNAKILQATFKAYQDYDGSSSPSIGLYDSEYFNNNTVTWNTKPTIASSPTATLTVQDVGWYTWDITDLVEEWNNSGHGPTWDFHLCIKNVSESSDMYKRFRSENYDNYYYPRFTVKYAEAPSAPTSVTVNPAATWTNGMIRVSWSGITQSSNATLQRVQYSTTSATSGFTTISSPSGLASGYKDLALPNGTKYVWIRGVNSEGLYGAAKKSSTAYKRDTVAPGTPTSVSLTPSTWTNGNITIAYSTVSDTTSGVRKYQYSTKSATSGFVDMPTNKVITPTGTGYVWVRAVDNTGNIGTARRSSNQYKVENVAPSAPTSVALSPNATSTSTDVTYPILSWSGLTDSGGSGLANAQYKIDSDSWVTIASSNGVASGSVGIDVTTEGTHTLYVRGIDNVGNTGATKSVTYILDNVTLNEQGGVKGYQQFVGFDTQSGSGSVNPSTGNLIYGKSDVSVSSPVEALVFSRTYNSQSTYATPLGTGWDYDYNIKLVKEFTGGSETGMTLKLGDGSIYHFTKNTNGTYTSPSGLFAELTRNSSTGKYLLTYNDETVYLFNLNNQIEKITNNIDNWIQFSYNALGKLTTIEDNAGNEITITYSTETGESGLIKTVSGGGRTYTYIYNSSRKLIQVYITCDSHQVGEQYEYTNGKLSTITNLNGYDYDISYNASGKVSGITNPLSQEMTIGYSTDNGKILITTEFNHVTQRYWYDSNSLALTKQRFESDAPTEYTYDSDYQVLTTTYPNDSTTTNTYTASGKILKQTNKDSSNNVDSEIEYSYTVYNSNGQPIFGGESLFPTAITESVSSTGEKVTDYRYNEDGTLLNTYVEMTHNNASVNIGGYVTNGIDGTDVVPDSVISFDDYDEFGNPETQTVKVAGGGIDNIFEAVTSCEYDSLGRLIETENPDGSTTSQSYDSYGNVETVTDGECNVTKYYYNILGQMIQETAAYGTSDATSTYYTYDYLGNVLTETDAKGYVTTYTYDALGRETRADYEDDTYSTTTYTVNTDGTQVTTDYDADGNKSISVADKKGQVILEGIAGDVTGSHNAVTTGNTYTYGSDTLIQYTRSTYDAMGNETWTTDNTGLETTNVYDDLGHLTSTTTGPSGHQMTTTYTYDDLGNVLTESTPEIDIIKTYDLEGRVLTDTQSKNGSTSTTTYNYDEVVNGKLRMIMTDPKGRQTIYEYNENQQIEKEILSGKTTEYTYDDNGNMLTSTLTNTSFPSESASTTYTYDSHNRQHTVTYGTGHYVTYAYDANGNVMSETLTKDGSNVVTAYTYDDMNRVTETERGGDTIAMYDYTDGGALASLQYGDSATDNKTGYVYDEAGKTIQVKDLTNGANTLIREYYYTDGNLSYLEDTRGTDDAKQEFIYDSLNRLETVKYYDTDDVTVLEEYTLTYNDGTNSARNQIETETTTTRYGGTVTVTEKAYTYDNLGRLTQESDTVTVDGGTPATTTTSYTYDAANNRTSMTSGATTLYYHYNNYDQLLCTDTDNDINTTGDIVTSYSYDLSDNQVTRTEGDVVTTYAYDDANWLEEVTEQDGQNPVETLATFKYDANGQRTQKTVGTAETHYFYNELDLLYTKNGSGVIIEQNILETDGSMIRSHRANGSDYWYRQDIRGSVNQYRGS